MVGHEAPNRDRSDDMDRAAIPSQAPVRLGPSNQRIHSVKRLPLPGGEGKHGHGEAY